MNPQGSDPARDRAGDGSIALEWLLPVLITAVVAAVLATGLVLSSAMLRRAALANAQKLLDGGARQLASVAATNIQQARGRYLAVARDSFVRRTLHGDVSRLASDSTKLALGSLVAATDSGMPIELWTADGRRASFVGRDVPLAIELSHRPEIADPPTVRREGLDSLRDVDSLQLGELYEAEGRVHFWLVMPVIDRRHAIGYIAQQRRIAAAPQTNRTLRELTGTPVTAYYGNVDGKFWATIGGRPASPHGRADDMLAAEVRIMGSPLSFALETPRAAVLAAPNALIRRLVWLALCLTIAGALLAWAIGRRVAKPILLLTRAAESVAAGNYSARVPSGGPQEIARLAASFNEMSHRIGSALAQLEQRKAELVALADAAQTANRAKSDFLATMSHELRTPLNAIGGYADLLELGLRGPVTDAQHRDLARIRANQQHLLGLIGGVLDLSRIESGRISYQLEPIAVDQLLSGLDALIAPQAASKDLALEYAGTAPDLVVLGDREKLRQILLNLLSNAIRNTPSGGRITMSADATEALVLMRVRDNGPGIPLDKQAAIFEPFVQLDRSLTQTVEGVGLGLSISRDLALGMSGELTVESLPGAGACFTVTLPRGPNEVLALAQTGEQATHEAVPRSRATCA